MKRETTLNKVLMNGLKRNKMDKVKFDAIMSSAFDILAVMGIVFLAYNGKDGWGWLIFLLILKHG